MNELKTLLEFNWKEFILIIFVSLVVIKAFWTLLEWLFVEKLGIETKSQRKHREDKAQLDETTELAKQTAINLDKLEAQYTKDEKDFRENLNKHMTESEKDRKALHLEMKQYSENRIKDRQQSIRIQEELTSSMDKLASMFLDKTIDDMRCEILNFCTSLSNGKKYNKEAYAHVFSVYEKYEATLEEHGMENGFVEESMAFIKEKYQEDLKNGMLNDHKI